MGTFSVGWVLTAGFGLAALVLLILKGMAWAAGWEKLKAAFPALDHTVVFAAYRKAITEVGSLELEGGAGRVGITDRGLLLHMANPFMTDVLVPFERVSRVRPISVLGSCSLTVDVDHEAPLSLRLPEEALRLLEANVEEGVIQEALELESVRDVLGFLKKALVFVKDALVSHYGGRGKREG